MENKEFMVNEEVIENAEEIAAGKSKKGLMVAAGIGVALLVGIGVYKIVKKVRANIKAKDNEGRVIEGVEYTEVESE